MLRVCFFFASIVMCSVQSAIKLTTPTNLNRPNNNRTKMEKNEATEQMFNFYRFMPITCRLGKPLLLIDARWWRRWSHLLRQFPNYAPAEPYTQNNYIDFFFLRVNPIHWNKILNAEFSIKVNNTLRKQTQPMRENWIWKRTKKRVAFISIIRHFAIF